MYYDDSYSNRGRISFSSIALLIIFVSAFALILAAIIWRPWSGDDEKAATLAPVAADQAAPAAADAAAVDPGAAAPEVAQPEVVTGP